MKTFAHPIDHGVQRRAALTQAVVGVAAARRRAARTGCKRRGACGARPLAAVFLAAGVLLAACKPAAQGDRTPARSTLEKVRATGIITLGHRENSIPFSYFDNRQHVVGYAHEVSLAIVEEVAKELGMRDLRVKLVPVTSQTRIPLLLNDTIDLECETTTNNASRQRQVAFSINYFASGTRFLVNRDSGVNGIEDLQGKNVIVSAGTTAEIALRKLNHERGLDLRIIAARDHGDAFAALEFGKAVAFMSDGAILYGEISKARKPDAWHVVGEPLTAEVYACAMRKNDAAFKAVVDRTVTRMIRDGDMRRLYARWFQSPIPPRQVNLRVPFDTDMQKLFDDPSDRPLQ